VKHHHKERLSYQTEFKEQASGSSNTNNPFLDESDVLVNTLLTIT